MTYRTHAARFAAGSSVYTNGEHDTLEAAEAEAAALILDGWSSVIIRDQEGNVVSRATRLSPGDHVGHFADGGVGVVDMSHFETLEPAKR